jgi:hypothetical protein
MEAEENVVEMVVPEEDEDKIKDSKQCYSLKELNIEENKKAELKGSPQGDMKYHLEALA